jgi:acyl-CoA thioester hydrolase
MTAPLSFAITVQVQTSDIDEQKHVNNTVYLRWMQEIAIAHWRAIASPTAQRSIGWVAVRHEIDYLAPAFLGDAIHLFTQVGKASRLTFERFTEVRRASDDKLLAKGRTLWCPVDPVTGRPVRVPADVRAQFSL